MAVRSARPDDMALKTNARQRDLKTLCFAVDEPGNGPNVDVKSCDALESHNLFLLEAAYRRGNLL